MIQWHDRKINLSFKNAINQHQLSDAFESQCTSNRSGWVLMTRGCTRKT